MKLKNTLIIIFCVVVFSTMLQAMNLAPEAQLEENIKSLKETSQELQKRIHSLPPNIPVQHRNIWIQRLEAAQQKIQCLEAILRTPEKKIKFITFRAYFQN